MGVKTSANRSQFLIQNGFGWLIIDWIKNSRWLLLRVWLLPLLCWWCWRLRLPGESDWSLTIEMELDAGDDGERCVTVVRLETCDSLLLWAAAEEWRPWLRDRRVEVVAVEVEVVATMSAEELTAGPDDVAGVLCFLFLLWPLLLLLVLLLRRRWDEWLDEIAVQVALVLLTNVADVAVEPPSSCCPSVNAESDWLLTDSAIDDT